MSPLKPDFIYFKSICETLNFSRAAEKLGMQQAALSKSVKKLEDQLGEILIYRMKGGHQLTTAGKNLYARILACESAWEQGSSGLILPGVVKLGCHPTIGRSLLPKILPTIEKEFALPIEIVFGTSYEITQQVSRLQIDFGLVINPIKNSDLIAFQVRDEFVAAWASKVQPIYKVVYFNPEMIQINQVLKRWSHAKMIAIRDYETIAGVVLESADACAILPSSVAETFTQLKPVSGKLLKSSLRLIYHKLKRKENLAVLSQDLPKRLVELSRR